MKKLLLALVLISTAAFAADRKLQTHQIEIKGGAGATPPTGSINLFNRNGVNRPAWKNSAGSQFFVNDFGYMTGSLVMPDPTSGSHGGVYSLSPVANNFLTGIDSNGVPTYAQPAYTDISGSLVIPDPSTGSHGGVYSSSAVSNQFLTGIGTDGVVTRAQPAFSNLSGSLVLSQITALSRKGGMIVYNGSSYQELAPGSDGSIIRANGASVNGVEWVTNSATASGSVVISELANQKVVRATIGGANATTACSSSPCAIFNSSGTWTTTIPRTGTGAYTINIISGVFSAAPVCVCNRSNTGVNTRVCHSYATSSTSITVQTADGTSSAADEPFNIYCVGTL